MDLDIIQNSYILMSEQKKRGGKMKNILIFIILIFISTGCMTKTIVIEDIDTRNLTGKILYDENGKTYSPRYIRNNLFCIDDIYNNKIVYQNEFIPEN